MDFTFGADVDPLRWLVQDQQLGLGRQPAGQGDFLLVAAAQAAADRVGARTFYGEVPDEFLREGSLAAKA